MSEQLDRNLRLVGELPTDGAELFDEIEGYLGRFFDLQFMLPESDHFRFGKFLFERHSLVGVERFVVPLPEVNKYDDGPSVTLFAMNSAYFRLSLREQEYCARMLEILTDSWPHKSIHLGCLLPAIVCCHRWPEGMDRFGSRQYIDGISDRPIDRLFSERHYETNDPRGKMRTSSYRSILGIYFELFRSRNPNTYQNLANHPTEVGRILAPHFKAEKDQENLMEYVDLVKNLGITFR